MLLSFDALVVIDSLTYVVSTVLLVLMGRTAADTARPPDGPRATGVAAEVLQGLRFLSGHRFLRGPLVVDSLFLFANGGLNVLLVPYMVTRLHAGADHIGLLMSALGVGYLVSAKVGTFAAGSSRLTRNIAWLLAAIGLFFAALLGVPSFAAALISIALVGVPGGALLMIIQISMQRHTPDHVLGRISAAFSTIDMAATVLGALGAASLAGVVGVLPVVVAAMLVFPVAALCAVLMIPAAPAAPAGSTSASGSASPARHGRARVVAFKWHADHLHAGGRR